MVNKLLKAIMFHHFLTRRTHVASVTQFGLSCVYTSAPSLKTDSQLFLMVFESVCLRISVSSFGLGVGLCIVVDSEGNTLDADGLRAMTQNLSSATKILSPMERSCLQSCAAFFALTL